MSIQDNHYTDEQVSAALKIANTRHAVALWKIKDWDTYAAIRGALLQEIRTGSSSRVGMRHIRYIYFVMTHVLPHCSDEQSEYLMFMADIAHRPNAVTHWLQEPKCGLYFKDDRYVESSR